MASIASFNGVQVTLDSVHMPLPNEEEQKQLLEMREQLKEDLEKAPSSEFVETVSDDKLIRYIRGYGHGWGDLKGVDAAVKAYRKMLKARADYPLINQLRKEIGEVFEEVLKESDVPHIRATMAYKYASSEQERKEWEAIQNITTNLTNFTKDGIVYSYLSYTDVEFENCVEVFNGDMERCVNSMDKFEYIKGILFDQQLYALSKKIKNKVPRIIYIVDSTGMTLSKLRALGKAPWKATREKKRPKGEDGKDPFETYIPEVAGVILVLNTPWFAQKIYNVFIAKNVEPRTQRKIVILGKDYKKRLLTFLDPTSIAKIMKCRKHDDEDDLPLKKDGLKMKKGIVKEVTVSGKPGDTIEWVFSVTKNTVDFSLILYVPNEGELEERIMLEPQRCKIEDGEIEGEYELEDLSEESESFNEKTEYLVGLKFSNKHSFLKTTKVNYEIKVTKEEADEEE